MRSLKAASLSTRLIKSNCASCMNLHLVEEDLHSALHIGGTPFGLHYHPQTLHSVGAPDAAEDDVAWVRVQCIHEKSKQNHFSNSLSFYFHHLTHQFIISNLYKLSLIISNSFTKLFTHNEHTLINPFTHLDIYPFKRHPPTHSPSCSWVLRLS